MDDAGLVEILDTSRNWNAGHGITGVLLYGEGSFIQVLEGEKTEVEYIFERIKADRRHKGLIKVLSGEIPERTFPTWTMGFKTMDAIAVNFLQGYFDPARQSFFSNEKASKSITMLKSFAHTNRLIVG
jgi:hypothetical protein